MALATIASINSAVDRRGVAHKYAGSDAIAARIRELAQGATGFRLRCLTSHAPRHFDISVENVIRIVTDGNAVMHASLPDGDKPAGKVFEREISSLFANDHDAARFLMRSSRY